MFDDLEDSLPDRAPGLSWTCHVCGEWRPDDKISVHTRLSRKRGSRIEVRENVRYCNDRPDCAAGAVTKRFLPEDEYEIIA